MKPGLVEPRHPFQGGQFQFVNIAPGSSVADQFVLVKAEHRFGHGIIEAFSHRSDRRYRSEFGDAFAVADRGELAAGVRMRHQPLKTIILE